MLVCDIFIIKSDGIVFFIQVIQTVYELLFSTSSYEKKWFMKTLAYDVIPKT